MGVYNIEYSLSDKTEQIYVWKCIWGWDQWGAENTFRKIMMDKLGLLISDFKVIIVRKVD